MKDRSNIQNLKSKIPPVCLTVAGHDPSGGAGIVADVETFTTFGCYAACAITSLTFQNTTGVYGAAHQTAETVRRQIEPVLQDFSVAAMKTGMMPTAAIIKTTARTIKENNLPNLIVDPVVRSTSGFDLIDDAALRVLVEKLFPLAVLITPNLPEAERIAQMKIKSESDVFQAARTMRNSGAKNILIKGGHFFKGSSAKKSRTARDFLFIGDEMEILEAEYIETKATHGTGCTLSAAIAANLALGKSLSESVEVAKRFVTEAIRTAPLLGSGNPSVNHLMKIVNSES